MMIVDGEYVCTVCVIVRSRSAALIREHEAACSVQHFMASVFAARRAVAAQKALSRPTDPRHFATPEGENCPCDWCELQLPIRSAADARCNYCDGPMPCACEKPADWPNEETEERVERSDES